MSLAAFTFTNNAFTIERSYGFTQSLEWLFKRTYRISVAQAEEQIAEEAQQSVRQDVIAAAREAFLSVPLAQTEPVYRWRRFSTRSEHSTSPQTHPGAFLFR